MDRRKISSIIAALVSLLFVMGCSEDPNANLERLDKFIRKDTTMVANLRTICEKYPARLSGSENNTLAQQYIRSEFERMGFDVDLMEVEVPNWYGGESSLQVKSSEFNVDIPCVSLGLAEGTGGKVVEAPVIEVRNREEFDRSQLEGKIVFINDPMKNHGDYGRAGWQRREAAGLAAEKGAVGIIIRSLSQFMDTHPHTGSVTYSPKAPKIPALAVSTIDAEKLSGMIASKSHIRLAISSTAHTKEGKATGNNVIAEIKGSVNPENVILVTGHLDSWHISQGAHDDASGVVLAMNVLRAFKETGIKPNNTIRIMPYQDEEVGLQGIHTYSTHKKKSGEKHLLHLEIDLGVGTPKEIMFFADSIQTAELNAYLQPFKKGKTPFLNRAGNINDYFSTSADLGAMMGYLVVDNHDDYFLYHHASNDNFEVINLKQLKDCSSFITRFVYLIDKYYK